MVPEQLNEREMTVPFTRENGSSENLRWRSDVTKKVVTGQVEY